MTRLFGVVGILFFGYAALGPHVLAQSSQDLYGSARASALGHGITAILNTAGVHANPAAPASFDTRTVTFYAREGFGLKVLRYGALFSSWPTPWGVLSTGASTFGTEVYRETHLSLGYARALQLGTTRTAHLGVVTRYYHTEIQDYGNDGVVGLHLGLVLPLLSTVNVGVHATNVNGPSFFDDESLPQTLAIGFSYHASPRIRVVADIFKDLHFPASIRGGIEVHPISLLALRAGIITTPTQFTGGIGLRLNHLQADLAAEQHQELGWSPSASLRVNW